MERIKDAASLHEIVRSFVQADSTSSINRTDVQKMLDGIPPYIQAILDETGQGEVCNLNFGDGSALLEAALAAYHDLTESVDTLAYATTDYGDPAERAMYEGVISEEHHRLVKDSPDFEINFQLLCHNFVTHGVGIPYWEDEWDWRWKVGGLDDFKFARGVRANEGDIEEAICLRELTVGQLYRFYENADNDDKRWNRREVETAILGASDGGGWDSGRWEKMQQQLKNNDALLNNVGSKKVKIVHAWIQERNGKVSHYISLQDGSNKDYLFKAPERFESMSQALIFFTYGIGTNGTLHSIRGYAHKIFPFVQTINKLRCDTVNAAKLSGSMLLQAASDVEQEDMAILFYNGCAVLPPGVNAINGYLTNPSNNVLPVVRDLEMTLQNNTGTYQSRGEAAFGQERTKFEIQAQLQKESNLSTSAMNLFYLSWRRLLNEQWRRISNPDLSAADPGGKEVFEFLRRCKKRGVPIEAIRAVRHIEPVRSIGAGSPGSRLLALDDLNQTSSGLMDTIGQNHLLRARVALRVGWSQVDRYVPKLEQGGREPIDVQVAELQNVAMGMMKEMSVLPGDHHIVHVRTHMPSLEQDLDLLESGRGSPELLETVKLKADHISTHMESLQPDIVQKELFAEYRRQFNNARQRVESAMLAVQKEREREERQAPAQSPVLAAEMEKHQLKQQMMVEDHQLKQKLKESDVLQKLALRDAEAAAKLRAQRERERVLASTQGR